MNFRNIVDRMDSFDWNEWVYIDLDSDFNLDSECVVVNPDNAELSYDGFTPRIVKDRNFSEFLQISDIRSVIENIFQQEIDVNYENILKACKFYFDNDAYLNFKEK